METECRGLRCEPCSMLRSFTGIVYKNLFLEIDGVVTEDLQGNSYISSEFVEMTGEA